MQPVNMLPKLSDSAQTISFTEGEGVCSVEVLSSEVLVNTTPSSPTHGSSKVKLKSLVDYNWECKFYSGRLLAMHMTGNYLAYSIKAPNTVTPGNWSGMVRVVYNGEPGVDRRALVKGMKGEVHDVSFAHIEHQILLACIDEQGNFYVHDIELTDSGLRCSLLAEIREDTGLTCAHHRVVWCPYIPDEDDAPDDDVARLLLTTHGSTARMWNLRQIISQLESSGEKAVAASTLLAGPGVLTASEHTAPIVDAAFSPDGTALATAAADGYVMFFQVYMSNATTPRCLHKWLPHAGKPLSCLFFLDNHKNYNSDVQFWKFAVTGAENNTTLKIWSCKSWSCLQTITFTAGLPTEPSTLGLKAMLDTSASYLILSDSKNKSLFILHMARDSDDTTAYCKSISEFLLPYPVLSFCIVDAGEHPGPCESSCDDPYHRTGGSAAASPADDYEPPEEEGLLGACTAGARRVRVQLYIVQPKGLQHGELSFPPPAPAPPALVPPSLGELELGDEASDSAPAAIASSILQQQSQQLKNLLMRSQTQPGSLIGTRPESPAAAPPPPLNLMTPDAFSSPGKRDEEDPPLSATPDVAGAHRNSTSGFPPAPPRSTGSSPSREVQEIMASDHRHYYKDMTDEPSQSPEPAAEPDLPAPLQNGDAAFYPEQPPLDSSRASNEWPQISIEQINEANQRDRSSNMSAARHASSDAVDNVERTERAERTVERTERIVERVDDRKLDELSRKIDALTELVGQQSRELRTLRADLHPQHERVQEALAAHASTAARAVETALTDHLDRISRASSAAGSRAAAAAGAGAARALEPLAQALQNELAAKLSATDQLLRENIDKLVNSKTIMERLSGSIAAALADLVRSSFREALGTSLLPQMEKAHANIFKQINLAFQNGTKEFAAHTETAARAAAERGGAAASTALLSALEQHAALLQQARLAPLLRDAAHEVLQKEMGWFREQARSVAAEMSRAHSPAPSHAMDRQIQVAQIESLLRSGDYNGAFQLALSASELSVVSAACRGADPALATPQLRQHVLLSLVQQLAADLHTDTQIKHRYLEEAIMNLDTNYPVTREHLPIVIRELQKQIMTFLSSNPGHPLTRQFKMLLMATESLVKASV